MGIDGTARTALLPLRIGAANVTRPPALVRALISRSRRPLFRISR